MSTKTLHNLTIADDPPSAVTGLQAAPGPVVYLDAASRYVPTWRETIGVAPWLTLDHRAQHKSHRSSDGFETLVERVSAAACLGLWRASHETDPNSALICEQVRATLVLWQSHLSGDGRYLGRRHHPQASWIIAQITQLLGEADGYADSLLLDDISRHLDHLAAQPHRACWLDAVAASALTDGALLLRRTELLRTARARVASLLTRQSEEGWFPENGGADTGLLSLTIDALARLYHRHEWEELSEPLARALRFLRYFVTPNGSVSTNGAQLTTGAISPYGLELLAPTHGDAHALAIILRRRYRSHACEPTLSWSRTAALQIGPGAILGARYGHHTLDDTRSAPVPTQHVTRFERAGLMIVQTRDYRAVISERHGGTVWVWWAHTGTVTLDQGICVVFAGHTRISGGANRNHQVSINHPTITCAGVLRRLTLGETPRLALRRWWRRLLRPRRSGSVSQPPLSGTKPLTEAQQRALLHDYFRREITLQEDGLQIRDEIICRTHCQAIICGSELDTVPTTPRDATLAEQTTSPPLYLPGSKHTVITRSYVHGALRDVDQVDLE